MKATKANIGRAVDQPGSNVRFYLFFGQDEGQCRALGARLLEALGATKFALSSGELKSDPARLVDEASAMSLFGGKRAIWIEPATKDIEEAVRALLEGPAPESPVVAIGGALNRSTALVKLAETSPLALAFAAYPPEGPEAERMVIDIGRRHGLQIAPALAARLADNCGNDQAIVAQEVQKFALYLDASTHAPKELGQDVIDDVGAESAEGDLQRIADLALSGDIAGLTDELGRLGSAAEAIPAVRSLQRRLLMLAPARARVERGERVDAVMTALGRAVFWKEKASVERMLNQWSAADLATVAERAGKLERELMFTPVPDRAALGEELLAIARKARSKR